MVSVRVTVELPPAGIEVGLKLLAIVTGWKTVVVVVLLLILTPPAAVTLARFGIEGAVELELTVARKVIVVDSFAGRVKPVPDPLLVPSTWMVSPASGLEISFCACAVGEIVSAKPPKI